MIQRLIDRGTFGRPTKTIRDVFLFANIDPEGVCFKGFPNPSGHVPPTFTKSNTFDCVWMSFNDRSLGVFGFLRTGE